MREFLSQPSSKLAQRRQQAVAGATTDKMLRRATAKLPRSLSTAARRSLATPTYANSVTEIIGKTPMVKLNRVVPEGAATVLVKLEMQNPGGSLKDRIAKNMIEKAEAEGKITPGVTTLVDFTSGNTGIGEALVAAAKGYKCIIVMPQVPPMFERYIICRQFGADVHLLNPTAGGVAWVKYTKELAAQPNHWYIGQMENENNPSAHIDATGPEIWKQAGGSVDYFVHGIGTGGCIAGVGKYLKEQNPAVKVVALEPSESRIHIGAPGGKHGIVGWAPGFHSSFLEGADKPAAEE